MHELVLFLTICAICCLVWVSGALIYAFILICELFSLNGDDDDATEHAEL